MLAYTYTYTYIKRVFIFFVVGRDGKYGKKGISKKKNYYTILYKHYTRNVQVYTNSTSVIDIRIQVART